MRSGFSPPVRFASVGHIAEISWKTSDLSRKSHNSGAEAPTSRLFEPLKSSKTRTSCSGCGYGNGLSRTACTTVNTATFRPDSERQGQNRRQRESRAAAQLACRVAAIVSQVLHPAKPVRHPLSGLTAFIGHMEMLSSLCICSTDAEWRVYYQYS
jgi:hypothetical protein